MKIAIFDLDGTLSEGPSGADLSIALEKENIIKSGYTKANELYTKDYLSKKISYNEILPRYLDAIKASYANADFAEIYKYTKDIYKPITKVYDWVAPLFESLHSRDYLISVVSASFDFYLEALQEELDFDTFYGSSFEIVGGYFTGEAKLPITDSVKAKYVKSLKKGNKIIVTGDSLGDVPMLELADVGFYLSHKNGGNLHEKPDLDHVKVVSHDNIVDEILAVA